MFCPHCGSNLSDNSKFCSKCGAALAPTLTNTISTSASVASKKSSDNNTKKYLFLACIAVLCLCAFLVSHKTTGNTLSGTWVCDNVEHGYPDSLTLESDGTGIVDGVSISWYIDGDTFVMVAGIYGNYYYEYKLSGNTLSLDGYTYHRSVNTSSSNYLKFDSGEGVARKTISESDFG